MPEALQCAVEAIRKTDPEPYPVRLPTGTTANALMSGTLQCLPPLALSIALPLRWMLAHSAPTPAQAHSAHASALRQVLHWTVCRQHRASSANQQRIGQCISSVSTVCQQRIVSAAHRAVHQQCAAVGCRHFGWSYQAVGGNDVVPLERFRQQQPVLSSSHH